MRVPRLRIGPIRIYFQPTNKVFKQPAYIRVGPYYLTRWAIHSRRGLPPEGGRLKRLI